MQLSQLSPSWDTNSHSATKQFPDTLWNLKIPYHVHKSPALVPILSQIDSDYTTLSYFSKIHYNIILSSKSRFSQWSLSFWLSQKNPICSPSFSHVCYMPWPSCPRFDHSKLWCSPHYAMFSTILSNTNYFFTTRLLRILYSRWPNEKLAQWE
jgi:hypothetical protein